MRKHIRLVNNAVYANDGAGSPIAGVDELDSLASGAVVVLTDDSSDGDAIADPSAACTLTDEINILTGGYPGTGLFKPTLAEMVKETYIAPVNKVVDVGSNGTTGNLVFAAPFTDLTSIGVMINPVHREEGQPTFRRYDVALTSSMTLDNALDALVAKINADPNSLVTAVKNAPTTNRGLKLTGNGVNFGVSLLGEWADTDSIVVTTPYKVGFGTQALIQTMFDDNTAILGDRDGLKARRAFTAITIPSANYHVYTLNWYSDRNTMIKEVRPQQKQYVLVVPTTSTDVIADLDAVLAAINAA